MKNKLKNTSMSEKWDNIFRIYPPTALSSLSCYLEAGQGSGEMNKGKELWQRVWGSFGKRVGWAPDVWDGIWAPLGEGGGSV